MGHIKRNMGDRGTKSYLNCQGLIQEVPEEKSLSMLPRDHFCNVLVKNVAVFCLSSKNLLKGGVSTGRGNLKTASYRLCLVVTGVHTYEDL